MVRSPRLQQSARVYRLSGTEFDVTNILRSLCCAVSQGPEWQSILLPAPVLFSSRWLARSPAMSNYIGTAWEVVVAQVYLSIFAWDGKGSPGPACTATSFLPLAL